MRTPTATGLARAVEQSKLTAGEISRRADVGESLFYRYMKGSNTPGLTNARKILRALNSEESGLTVTLDEVWPEGATDA